MRFIPWLLGLATGMALVVWYGLVLLLLVLEIARLVYRRQFKPANWLVHAVTALLLVLIFLRPFGWIDFSAGSKAPVALQAGREGAANCHESWLFRTDSSFSYELVCFGSRVAEGRYAHSGDTLRLQYHSARGEAAGRFAFAVLSTGEKAPDRTELQFYRSANDPAPRMMFIRKNQLLL